jgi:hypothetical protein
MTPERAFRFSSILLAAAGLSGLVLTGELPLWLAILGGLSLALSGAQAGGYSTLFRLSRRAWNLLMVGAFIGFGVDLLWISQDPLPAGVHFLVILMVNKLLNLEQRKDFLHLYAISLLQLLAAAALTVELWYAAVFVTYLMAAIWTLLLYHLRNEVEERQAVSPAAKESVDPVHQPGPITSRFFWTTNAIAAGAFLLTLAIFFVTPRIGAGFFNKNRVEVVRTSGFSDQVDLGVIGAVKLDQSVVMRVEFPEHKGPPAERLYFRGAAYDLYNGRSWANTLARRRVLGRTPDGAFQVSREGSPGASDRSRADLYQEILIEPLDTSALFGVSFVDVIKGNFLIVQADGMGGLYLPYPPSARFQYGIRSTPDQLAEEDRTAASLTYPAPILEHFLQVPETSPLVAALARDVARQAKTPYEMVAAIERHLRERYQYSLDVGETMVVSPLEEFLFTRKTGYCEHYATAMVIMLRTLGVPARLATGFLPGEWNGFGNYYTVRQRDAHAWVEVFFPRSGWVTFDPTPNVGALGSTQFLSTVGSVIDSVRLKWDRFVIQYSFRDQMVLAQGLRERSDQLRAQARGLWTSLLDRVMSVRSWIGQASQPLGPTWVLVGGLLVGLAVVAFLAFAIRWKGRTAQGSSSLVTARQAAAVRLYGRMLRLLEARGLRKAPGATPLEFAKRVIRERPDVGSRVETLTHLYCRVRFGQAPLTPEDLRRAEDLLTGLRAVKR